MRKLLACTVFFLALTAGLQPVSGDDCRAGSAAIRGACKLGTIPPRTYQGLQPEHVAPLNRGSGHVGAQIQGQAGNSTGVVGSQRSAPVQGAPTRAFNAANISLANAEAIRGQKGIPNGWAASLPQNGRGVIFNPPDGNRHTSVRISPGEPNATYESQRHVYVKHAVNGRFFDVNKNPLPNGNNADAHIPFGRYQFWTN